jgi:hypothetical protein
MSVVDRAAVSRQLGCWSLLSAALGRAYAALGCARLPGLSGPLATGVKGADGGYWLLRACECWLVCCGAVCGWRILMPLTHVQPCSESHATQCTRRQHRPPVAGPPVRTQAVRSPVDPQCVRRQYRPPVDPQCVRMQHRPPEPTPGRSTPTRRPAAHWRRLCTAGHSVHRLPPPECTTVLSTQSARQ